MAARPDPTGRFVAATLPPQRLERGTSHFLGVAALPSQIDSAGELGPPIARRPRQQRGMSRSAVLVARARECG